MISDGMAGVLRSLRLDAGSVRACVHALDVRGVGLSLLVGKDRAAEPLWCYPDISSRFEEIQFTLGEGPGPDAVRSGSPVVEPDLQQVRADRWPALLPEAHRLGVQGVYVFPLGIGATRVGVLTVLCRTRRGLSGQQYEDATVLAAALTVLILNADGAAAQRGVDGQQPGPDGSLWEEPTGLHRATVHQATGMVSVQLGVPMTEALVRLRAYAFGTERALGEVAQDVVDRRLRFHDDISGPDSAKGRKG